MMVGASLALAALGTSQLVSGDLHATSKAWQMATVAASGVFAVAALILSWDSSPQRDSTRRRGVSFDVAVAGCLYLPQLLQSLGPSEGASGGAGVFGSGPALTIPLL